ncbi:MAG TPA: molecular chaperone HtpG [Planctomycetota bacterium]|nr:molecular chaperone HtpG [Planctomycetota bacterium]
MTQHAFQTEVQQLLHLMIHSLYSEREIFLRELVSNASDACDKLRFASLTEADLMKGDDDLHVEIVPDEAAGTLVIRDTGIGMTEADAIEHLGTIAKSGTKAFLSTLPEDQAKQSHLIGQFGVGFYSAFMVADRIVVESRSARASSDQGVRWESTGDGTFKTETVPRARRGTEITLHLKDDAKEFLQQWRLRELIKKYSDYVAYPVRIPKYVSQDDLNKGVKAELEQVNAGQALWTRPKDQISDEQYAEFYKAACHQFDEPATRLHVTVEGTLSFTALLFIPGERPMDLFDRDHRGLSLYVRRVFVMDHCKDLLPEWLRFVRGVVDSDDLPLNVSREILQQQDSVQKLRKQLVKRILDHLTKLAKGDEKEQATFATIDRVFGAVLREGLVVEQDKELKEKIAKLVRWRSTWTRAQEPADDERVTGLDDYVARMKEDQKEIYVLTAPSLVAAKASPHLEGFVKKGYEVLLLVDSVDEWVTSHFTEFAGKPIRNIAKGDADAATDDEKKAIDEKQKEMGGFLEACKKALSDDVADVRLSARLTDSPCCLVAGEHGITPQMEELMRRMGRDVPAQKRILELNADHPLVARLRSEQESGAPAFADHLAILRDQALLAEGSRVPDAAAFAKRVQDLLLGSMPPAGKASAAGG